jgi:tRNA dimethylallyltransferase
MPEVPAEPARVIAIVGPTGVGKSALAEAAAEALGGEIVSADSMQVYRGMDIGTAKVPIAERAVPYHCVDVADPGESFSAALYQRCAREAIDDIAERGLVPVLIGGTGLYVRAAVDDLAFLAGEAASPDRQRIEADLERLGPQGLHAVLAEHDPASARLIHPNNARRVVRALEMLATQGASYAQRVSGLRQRRPVYPTTFVGLTMDRAALYRRIDRRVEAMLGAGLLDEVRGLLDAGYRDALTSAQAIGYKELVPVIDGASTIDVATAAIQQATRRYAKRQLTWFRADSRVRWLDVTDLSPAQALDETLALIESAKAHDTLTSATPAMTPH